MDSSTLLLIDGLNVLRPVYEANQAPDSVEKAKRACRSALSTYRRLLARTRPTHALAVFDHGGRNWRHDLYPGYRAHRSPMANELRQELPGFRDQLTEALGLPTISPPGIEADDALAYAAERWLEARRGAVIIVSNDKDLLQLLHAGALVQHPFDETVSWDAAKVQARFGVEPYQMGDLLALMGDSSDGVPGVAGVGPKTAAKLLREHGNLTAVLEAAAGMPGAVGEKLRAGCEIAQLSRELVSFRVRGPLDLNWRMLMVPAQPGPPSSGQELRHARRTAPAESPSPNLDLFS